MFTSISPVDSFCSESVSASTDPSTSPLSMMLSSLNSPKAIRLPISSRVICFWVRTFCSRSSWVLLAAICLASLSSLKTKNVSPAWGAHRYVHPDLCDFTHRRLGRACDRTARGQ